jgi:DNA excision repair protein ERCC-2
MNLFPFKEMRPVQEDFINTLKACLRSKRDFIVHAPTGLGKTVAALVPALEVALEKDLVVFFLTSRHTQHKIGIETLKDIKKQGVELNVVDIIGKKWMCLIPGVSVLFSGEFSEYCKKQREKRECEFFVKTRKTNGVLTEEAAKLLSDIKTIGPMHNEDLIKMCKEVKVCPYEMSLALGETANVVIGDYYYLFNPSIRDNFLSKIKKDVSQCIVIADEGHNLPARIREMMTERLSTFMIKNAIKEAKKFEHVNIIRYLSLLQDILNKITDKMGVGSEKLVYRSMLIQEIELEIEYEQLMDDLDFAGDAIRAVNKRSYVGSVGGFLRSWFGPDQGFARIIEVKKTVQGEAVILSYRCLDPSLSTRDAINDAYTTIIMSGTLTPTSMYKNVLGFDKDAVEKTYKSPFDEENKLSLIIPETTTKFTERSEAQYERIAEICSDVVNQVPGNCFVFFPSYFIRDSVNKYFSGMCEKTTFVEVPNMQKHEKDEMLEKFKQYKGSGAVLLGAASGNFGEGIDLPGDLLKCVVVVGLPLSSPDLETKELIKYYDAKFGAGWDYGYLAPAMHKTIQAAGRCIRTETDKGAVVFLDKRFVWSNYAKYFPKDWEIRVSRDYENEVKDFFLEF